MSSLFSKTIKRWKVYFAFGSIFLSLVSPAISNTVFVNQVESSYPLGKNLSYYIDDTNQLGIEEVSSPDFDSKFIQSNTYDPSFGFQESTFWVKISIKNERTKGSNFYLEEAFAPIDFIEIYTREENEFHKTTLGDNYPFHHRTIKHRNHVAAIFISPENTKTLYLKFNTKSVMVFRLTLHDESSISMKTSQEQFFFGMFYGIILVLLFTNCFLYFSLKEKLYLYYIAYTFSLGMYFFVFNGFAFSFFWSNSIYWNDLAIPFFMTLIVLTGTRTSIHFLKLSEYSKTVKKVLDIFSVLVSLDLFFLFLLPFKYSFYYLYILIIPTAVVIFWGAGVSLIRKNPLAKFFVLGFSSFIICGFLTVLNNLGVLKGYLSPDLMQMASGISIIILSIGLAHRYYLLKQQNLEIETKSVLINSRLNQIQNELEISKKIHESLLPSKLPSLKSARIFAKYLPSGEIGGDFFDYYYLEDKFLGVFIADVTGHGVPAALFASIVKFSFSRETEFMKDPAKLLANINSSLFERIGNNFLSAGYFCLDLNSRRITYASCGHPPLLIWKKEEKEFIELKPKGRLIGIAPEIVLHDTIYKLEEGDRILFYTDGLIECENAEGIPFAENALYRFTLQNENLSAEDFSNALVLTLNQYSSTPGHFSDDVTFIVIDVL